MGHSVVPSGGACGAAGARTRAACPSVQGGGAAQNIQHDGRTYVAGGFVYPISHRARDACMYNAWPSLSRRKENRVAVPRRWRGGSGPGQRAAVAVLSPPKPLKHADGDCKLLFCIFEIHNRLYICATCYCFRSQGCSYHRSAWRCGSHSDVLRRYRATLPHDVANHAGSTLWKDLSRAPPSLPDANAPTPRNRTMPSDASVAWDLLVHQAALILWYFQFVSV